VSKHDQGAVVVLKEFAYSKASLRVKMGVQKSFNLSTLKILAPWVLPIWMSKCCYVTPWVSLGMQQNLKQAN
jgi:hypothetical protein